MNLILAVFLIALAVPAHAVMRQPSLEETDTLSLQPVEAHDFLVAKLSGSDLHYTGYYLSLAAVPAMLLAIYDPGKVVSQAGLPTGSRAFYAFAYGVFPALAAVTAAGNMFYAQAARYHHQREYAISFSLLPFFTCSVAAAKLFLLATDPRMDRETGASAAALRTLALSEAFFIPALHMQFRAAETYLDQVRISVDAGPEAMLLRADF